MVKVIVLAPVARPIFIRHDPIGFPSHSTACLIFVSPHMAMLHDLTARSPVQDHSMIFFPVSVLPTSIARIERVILPGPPGRSHGVLLREPAHTLPKNPAFHFSSNPSMIGLDVGMSRVPIAPCGVFSAIGPLQSVSICSSLNQLSASVSFTAMMVDIF